MICLAIEALNDPIRQLIDRCRKMPRGKERSKLEEQLGKLLKRQDALILELANEETKCPT